VEVDVRGEHLLRELITITGDFCEEFKIMPIYVNFFLCVRNLKLLKAW